MAEPAAVPKPSPVPPGHGRISRHAPRIPLLPLLVAGASLGWPFQAPDSVPLSPCAALQGAIDNRVASAVITASECSALLGALLILLSMLGINIGSALLLPAGIAVAIAAKDLSTNWVAGFFLFVAQVGAVVGCQLRGRE